MSDLPSDDLDEKARRNFVAVSAAILLAWWLRVEVPFLASFVGLATDEQTRFRIWIAAIPILFYFGLRYHFSSQRVDGWKASTRDHLHRMYQRLETPIAKAIYSGQKAVYEARVRPDETSYSPFIFTASSYSVAVTDVAWKRAWCTWRRSDDEPEDFAKRFPLSPEDNHAFDIAGCDWIRINFLTAVESLSFSRGSIVILVPYALGLFALLACVSKVWIFP